jgi:hypothetical protein
MGVCPFIQQVSHCLPKARIEVDTHLYGCQLDMMLLQAAHSSMAFAANKSFGPLAIRCD